MKILVLNCGSSSIKYALYNMDDKSVMTSGGAERVGLDGAFVKVKLANGEKKQIMHDIPEHTEGVKFIFSLLTDPEIGVIKSLDEIDAVGHRMVHGGEKFNKSVVLTDEVLKAFSIPPSTRQCLLRLICMPSPTSCMRNMVYAAMVSTEPLTAMYQPVHWSFWA